MRTLSSEILEDDLEPKPLVTIAIPTFNRAASLKRCITSALMQSYKHFEILVSDNASEDETLKLLHSMSDPRLRVIRQQYNIGLFPNFNACLQGANGEYVVFVSDDDEIEPWFLEQCMILTKNQPNLPIVIALSKTWMATENRMSAHYLHPRFRTGIYDGPKLLLEFLRSRISVQMCSILFRTKIVRAAGGFPSNHPFAGDVATWAPILLSGKAGYVNKHCATYTHHLNNETWQFSFQSRAHDVCEVFNNISSVAEKCVKSDYMRWQIRMAGRLYLTMMVIKYVASCRDAGASMSDGIRLLWQLRNFVYRCRVVDYLAILGSSFMAKILLPMPVIRLLINLRDSRLARSRNRF